MTSSLFGVATLDAELRHVGTVSPRRIAWHVAILTTIIPDGSLVLPAMGSPAASAKYLLPVHASFEAYYLIVELL